MSDAVQTAQDVKVLALYAAKQPKLFLHSLVFPHEHYGLFCLTFMNRLLNPELWDDDDKIPTPEEMGKIMSLLVALKIRCNQSSM